MMQLLRGYQPQSNRKSTKKNHFGTKSAYFLCELFSQDNIENFGRA